MAEEASEPAPQPPAADANESGHRPAEKGTIGVGLILGEPTGICAKLYLEDDQAIQVAAGSASSAVASRSTPTTCFHPWILQDRDSFVLPVVLRAGRALHPVRRRSQRGLALRDRPPRRGRPAVRLQGMFRSTCSSRSPACSSTTSRTRRRRARAQCGRRRALLLLTCNSTELEAITADGVTLRIDRVAARGAPARRGGVPPRDDDRRPLLRRAARRLVRGSARRCGPRCLRRRLSRPRPFGAAARGRRRLELRRPRRARSAATRRRVLVRRDSPRASCASSVIRSAGSSRVRRSAPAASCRRACSGSPRPRSGSARQLQPPRDHERVSRRHRAVRSRADSRDPRRHRRRVGRLCRPANRLGKASPVDEPARHRLSSRARDDQDADVRVHRRDRLDVSAERRQPDRGADRKLRAVARRRKTPRRSARPRSLRAVHAAGAPGAAARARRELIPSRG